MIKITYFDSYYGKCETVTDKPTSAHSIIQMLEKSDNVISWDIDCIDNEYPWLKVKFYTKWK